MLSDRSEDHLMHRFTHTHDPLLGAPAHVLADAPVAIDARPVDAPRSFFSRMFGGHQGQ